MCGVALFLSFLLILWKVSEKIERNTIYVNIGYDNTTIVNIGYGNTTFISIRYDNTKYVNAT